MAIGTPKSAQAGYAWTAYRSTFGVLEMRTKLTTDSRFRSHLERAFSNPEARQLVATVCALRHRRAMPGL